MAIKKPEDLRHLTLDQLEDEALKLKKEQFNLRFQRATGQLENTSRVRQVRRDVARMLTIAKQKRSGDEPKVKAPEKPKTERPKVKRTAKARPPKSSRSKPNPKSRAKAKRSKK